MCGCELPAEIGLFEAYVPARNRRRPGRGRERRDQEAAMAKPTVGDDSVGRMQFLLHLRRSGIADAAVLPAMDEVPREHFVEPQFIQSAYADHAMPIACGQTISQPYVVAYMTEALALRPEHRVLEIGTGSGYQAAVLSRIVREVVSIERYRTLAENARRRLSDLGYRNVQVVLGDGLVGAPERAPFDRIIVTAAAETIPQALVDQLADGGIMVLPLGPHAGTQRLVKLTKIQSGIAKDELIAVRFVPLCPGQAQEL
jgi:protein-L-isoaspartate(D-aspartate) O-methyltransferase